jgi:hypothetical protein
MMLLYSDDEDKMQICTGRHLVARACSQTAIMRMKSHSSLLDSLGS